MVFAVMKVTVEIRIVMGKGVEGGYKKSLFLPKEA
jgi:hypothetical protein